MFLKEMQERKLKWKTVDDRFNQFSKDHLDYGFTTSSIALEPQRIRVFSIQFVPSVNGEKFLQ